MLKPACDTPGKHPALSKWQTRATTDEAQIREWWSLWPAYNVGIATGRDSDLLALDADGMAGLAEVSKRGVPPSPMVQTGRAGGGMHHYFSCPQDFDARNFAGKVPGLDARANGGYVLAPDSKHVSGETYTWVVKPDGPLPEPPQWLIDLLKQDRTKQGPVGSKIPKGLRDATLFSMARAMSRKGFDEESILDALRIENRKKCDVPLPDADLIRIAASAVRYGPDDELLSLPQSDAGNAERFAYLWGATTRHCVEDKDWPHCDLFGYDGLWKPATPAVLHRKLVETARRYQITTTAMPAATDEQAAARRQAMEYAMRLENERAYRAMQKMASAQLSITRSEFDTNLELLPTMNGVLRLRDSELLPPDPSAYHSRHSPVAFYPDFIDPVLEKYLDDTTAGVPGMRDALIIRMGYFATGYIREEELDFFVGPGGSGKSTLAEAIMAALGGFGVSMDAETFMKQDISSQGHTEELMSLIGKRFAVVQEPESDKRLRTGLLKKLSGGDTMSGRGIYEKSQEFTNQAKLAFIFNKAPTLPTNDDGLERRLWVWPFNNGRSKEDRNHAVKDHLTKSEEGRMAVLAMIARGAKQYLALERYPVPDFVLARTKELWDENDVIARFVEERCVTGHGKSIQYTPLWHAFSMWNKEGGGPAITNAEFRDWLDKQGHVSQKIGGKTTRKGIQLDDSGNVSYFRGASS